MALFLMVLFLMVLFLMVLFLFRRIAGIFSLCPLQGFADVQE